MDRTKLKLFCVEDTAVAPRRTRSDPAVAALKLFRVEDATVASAAATAEQSDAEHATIQTPPSLAAVKTEHVIELAERVRETLYKAREEGLKFTVLKP